MGKSTWINALSNYLEFVNLEEAAENNAREMIAKIPSKFQYMDEQVMKEVKIGGADSNEKQETGKSATQGPREYHFKIRNNINVN